MSVEISPKALAAAEPAKTPADMIRRQIDALLNFNRGRNEKFAFSCMEDLLNQHGTFFPADPVPLQKRDMRPMQQCFSNCQLIAHGMLDDWRPGDWTYVEGLAVRRSLGFPVHHGWVIDKEGRASDPTWRRNDESADDFAYFGVAIRPDYLRKHIARSFKKGEWVPIFDNWQSGFPVLTGKDSIKSVKWPPGRFPKAVLP